MEPTPEQLRSLYFIGRKLTAELRCYIRLIDLLPNKELCIVIQPRNFPEQRTIVYIDQNGGKRYV